MKTWTHGRKYFILFCFVLIGIFRGIQWKPQWPDIDFFKSHELCGTVGFPTTVVGSGNRVVLEDLMVDVHRQWGKVSVVMPIRPHVGDRICGNAFLLKVKNFGIDGEFDQERYYLSQGIWAKAKFSKKSQFKILKKNKWLPIQSLREKLSLIFEKSEKSSDGPLLKAMILGIKDELPKDLEEKFIRSGLIHMLVISGQNVHYLLFFIFTILFWILSRFEICFMRFELQRALVIVSIFPLLLFYLFSGMAIPILRAIVMSGGMLIALWSSQSKSGFYILGWAVGGSVVSAFLCGHFGHSHYV